MIYFRNIGHMVLRGFQNKLQRSQITVIFQLFFFFTQTRVEQPQKIPLSHKVFKESQEKCISSPLFTASQLKNAAFCSC